MHGSQKRQNYELYARSLGKRFLWFSPGFLEIKVQIDDLLHSLRDLLNPIRDKIAASFQVSAEFRSVPSCDRSLLGRPSVREIVLGMPLILWTES